MRPHPAPQVVPTRKVRGKKKAGAAAASAAAGQAAAAEEEDEEEGGGALNPDDLLPRTDISGSITPALLAMISSSNWKERNAGVDQVAQLLAEASQRIEPNVGELFPALKVRAAAGLLGLLGLRAAPAWARSSSRRGHAASLPAWHPLTPSPPVSLAGPHGRLQPQPGSQGAAAAGRHCARHGAAV